MSFLNVRGEMIHCEKCGATRLLEYAGGPQFTQIGDFGCMEQIELSKMFMPEYNAEQEGYYYHRFGVCQKCVQKRHNAKIFCDDYIVFQYLDKVNEFNSLKGHFEYMVVENLKKNINVRLLEEINPTAFDTFIHTKHFGIKKEKRRISEIYVNQSKKQIFEYLKRQLDSNSELNELKELVLEMEIDVKKELSKYMFSIEGFLLDNVNDERNLNPYICYEATTRVPAEQESTQAFYIPIKYSKKEVEKILHNTKKFDCNIDEYSLEDLFRRLPQIISKIDF